MLTNRNRLYILVLVACMIGYIWVFFSTSVNAEVGVCLVKHVTNIPCPSCGSTRSVLSLLEGKVYESILINPIGILLVGIMILSPIWIFRDLLTKSNSFFSFYKRTELFFQQWKVAIPAIFLVLSNWIWNIFKDL